MDKLKMHTPNKADENFAALAKLFPNAVTETIIGYEDEEEKKPIIVRAIDKDVLMQEINTRVVEGREERYQFTWPDKKKAVLAANSPINSTLRPCREESVDFDATENLYIEGDNLHVLKLLQETYLGKVKMIYIDPPYNTGNDFVYNDDFAESAEDYLDRSGQYDEEGNRLVQNTESNGRFHTDWLNMIYPRLKLAKSLLAEDGVIFISIDENEIENLKKVCNDIFGEANSLGTFIWRKKDGGGQAKEAFVIEHEYIVVYRKSSNFVWIDKMEARDLGEYNKVDEKGRYKVTKLAKWGNTARREDRPSMYFPITAPDGTDVFPIAPDGSEGRWRVGVPKMKEIISNELVHWEKKNNQWIPYEKEYFDNQTKTIKERSILYNIANTGDGSNVLTSLFGKKDTFENPKPIEIIKLFLQSTTKANDIILDFFSGSATTAHAIMQLNSEEISNHTHTHTHTPLENSSIPAVGRRKFIMVQLPEPCDEKSEAYKAGYKNICEIGKERIRRAAKKIAEEHPEAKFDGGFRVLKLDTSNMQEVYYTPAEFTQATLDGLESNIKPDRTPMDLLFQVMLDLGVLLSSKIEETTICGKTVFNVEDNYLIACFDENITDEVITAIAKQKPYYFVMRDSSMADDSVATNFEQIFATYSPDTVRKVL